MKHLLFILSWVSVSQAQSHHVNLVNLDEVNRLPSEVLCAFFRDKDFANTRAMMSVMRKRNLGDCSSDHFTCVGLGYKYQTTEYSNCKARQAKLLADAILPLADMAKGCAQELQKERVLNQLKQITNVKTFEYPRHTVCTKVTEDNIVCDTD